MKKAAGQRLVFLTLGLLALLTLGSLAPVVQASDDPDNRSDSIRFREQFGLSVERGHIDAVSRSSTATHDYGVPLSISEDADIDRRVAMQYEMPRLTESLEARSDFGGIYIDQGAGGVIVVQMTGGEATVAPTISANAPEGAEVRVVSVKRSWADLEALQSMISKDMDTPVLAGQVSSLGIIVQDNVVEVALLPNASVTATDLRGRYGEGIRVVTRDEDTLAACVDWNNCAVDPWRGGLKINNPTYGACSSGFVAKAPNGGSARKMFSAGHCGPVNSVWTHDGVHFGTLNTETLYEDSRADSSLINIVDSWASNIVILDEGVYRSITGQRGHDADTVGDLVCQSGYRTKDQVGGYRCGTLAIKNDESCADGICVQHQRVANIRVAPGDSGGPVFEANTAVGTVRAARGPLVGGDHYDTIVYSSMWHISDETGGWHVLTVP